MAGLNAAAYPRLLRGHRVRLLRSGAEFFPALLEGIAQAQREVRLETYIFKHDAVGLEVGEALMAAARRGVEVRLLLDGFGSHDLPEAFSQRLAAAGVRLLWYRRERWSWRWNRQRLRRLHRKVAVIDGRIALVGGINIVADCEPGLLDQPRYDFAVSVQGPVLDMVYHSSARLWNMVRWVHIARRPPKDLPLDPVTEVAGRTRVAFLRRDNLRHRRDIELFYLRRIEQAREEVIIANAYFLPGRRFRRALRMAAQRGVRVSLLLQGMPEYRVVVWASRALHRPLLRAGVQIHEYLPSHLHAKVAVFDQRWVTVGSSNIDPFSLVLAQEANVVVHERAFAQLLREELLTAIRQHSRQIQPHDPHLNAWWGRALSWLCLNAMRVAMGLSGFRFRSYD